MSVFILLDLPEELHTETSLHESVKFSQDEFPVSAESTLGENLLKKKKSVLITSPAKPLSTSCKIFYAHNITCFSFIFCGRYGLMLCKTLILNCV